MGRKKKSQDKESVRLEDISDNSDNEIDSKELAVLNSILNVKKNSPEEYGTLKFVMYATGIFLLLALPFTDRIIELALPLANSWLILVGVKTVIFFIIFYIVFYMHKTD